MRYVQPNGPFIKAWLPFDIDHEWSAYRWDDVSLPAPNYITSTPETGRSHYLYALQIPLQTGPNGRPGPVRYAAAIHRAFTRALAADPGYAGLITKNPHHHHWTRQHLHRRTYSLDDLAGWVDLEPVSRVPAREDRSFLGRNVALFDSLRFWAYEHVVEYRKGQHEGVWRETLMRHAQELNLLFRHPLPVGEIKATVKSVSTWTWSRYTGRGRPIARGIMGLDGSGLPLAERQRLSAERTNHVRIEATTARVVTARRTIEALGASVPDLSAAAIAERAGVHRETVRRRRLSQPVAQKVEARRQQVAILLSQGLTQKEVASRLGVTDRQIKRDTAALKAQAGGDILPHTVSIR